MARNRFRRSFSHSSTQGSNDEAPTFAQMVTVLTRSSAPQLDIAKCIISRLRYDRDAWCMRAQEQEHNLQYAERKLRQKNVKIASLSDTNRGLQSRLEQATKTEGWLVSRCHNLERQVDVITKKWGDAARTTMRLKRSDRTKGKVTQRNLSLKAILGRKIGTEETLIEALNEACERIQQLENAGEKLLKALDGALDADADADTDMDMDMDVRTNIEQDCNSGICASTMEAEIKFRCIVEDDSFRNQKENWSGYLDD